MKKLKITVLVDDGCIGAEDPEFATKQTADTTESHVINSLRKLGHDVGILGVAAEVTPLVSGLGKQKPDLVFNLTEQFRGDRALDANVAALIEMLGIPFTGTGSAGLLLCRRKGLCKELLSRHSVRVPDFVTLVPGTATQIRRSFRYPSLVKPAYEDGSEGIHGVSLVADEAALRERAAFVHERWRQPAIAEEFIEGRELYVSILGNTRLTVLPPREVFFGNSEDGPSFATYRVKWSKEYQKKWNIKYGFAELDSPTLAAIARTCRRAYRLLQVRDYGRVDLRLTPEGRIVVLEVNANPDLACGDEVAESAGKSGIVYDQLIERVVNLAMKRYE